MLVIKKMSACLKSKPVPRDKSEVRFWKLPQMRETIKALENAGYAVKKDSAPNYVVTVDDQEVLRAMRNTRGMYLVRYNRELFAKGGQS